MLKYYFALLMLTAMVVSCAAPSVYMQTSKEHMKQMEWSEAKEQLALELKINPQNAKAYYWLGNIHRNERDFGQMITAFDSSLNYSNRYSSEIQHAIKKTASLMFFEGKRIAIHPIIANERNEEIRGFSRVFADNLYQRLNAIDLRTSPTFLTTKESATILKEFDVVPKIQYDTPSGSFRLGFYQPVTRKNKVLKKMGDEIIPPEDLKKMKNRFDGILYCVIAQYNEVKPSTELGQKIFTGLLGVSVSEKNIVKMNIILYSAEGEYIAGTNEELEFESFADTIDDIRVELSERVCSAYLGIQF